MTLAELIDIEIQMMKDQDADPTELRQRDRSIGQQLNHPLLNRRELFAAWLNRVKIAEHPSAGQLFETGYRWLRRILLFLGLISGGGAAASVLSYDGSKPVNIVNFLAALVGIQIITILFFLLNSSPAFVRRVLPGNGEFYNFVRELSYLFGRFIGKIIEHLPAKQLNKLWQDLQRLKIKQKLYGSVEKWLIIRLTQRFGLAFNVGALATCLYLVTFSDLAFAWNTTLDVKSSTFHTIVRSIAAPWSPIVPTGVPSLELVEQSRYFQLDEEYIDSQMSAGQSRAIVVGRWWLFLILCLVVYGFLPRIIIYTFSNIKLKTAFKRLPLNSAEFESLYDRLTRPLLQTRTIEPKAPALISQIDTALNHDIQTDRDECIVIKWGDVAIPDEHLNKLVESRFGLRSKNPVPAGGFDYVESNLIALESLQNLKKSIPVLILVESWESPGASILNFIKQVRSKLNSAEQIIVGLVNTASHSVLKSPDKVEWQVWKNGIARLTDPYVRVEAMVEKL